MKSNLIEQELTSVDVAINECCREWMRTVLMMLDGRDERRGRCVDDADG